MKILIYAFLALTMTFNVFAKNGILTSVVDFLPKIKKIDYALKGENNIYTYEVTIINSVNKPINVNVIAQKPLHVDKESESLAPYLINKNLKFAMGPNEKRKYSFEFNLPKGISGTKYLGYSFDGTVLGKTTGFVLKQQNRGLLLLNFKGTGKQETLIKIDHKINKKLKEVYFSLNMENVGNTFLQKIKNTGILFKKNKDKKEFIGKTEIESVKKQYLPQGNSRIYTGKIKTKNLEKGKYELMVNTVDFRGYTKITNYEFEI